MLQLRFFFIFLEAKRLSLIDKLELENKMWPNQTVLVIEHHTNDMKNISNIPPPLV